VAGGSQRPPLTRLAHRTTPPRGTGWKGEQAVTERTIREHTASERGAASTVDRQDAGSPARTEPRRTQSGIYPGTETVGAVVVGGNFPGLGIVRSLGRRGIPVCVIDDEISVSRVSRYTTHHVRVPDLLDEQRAVDTVLDVGR